jgi:hypothetical protein
MVFFPIITPQKPLLVAGLLVLGLCATVLIVRNKTMMAATLAIATALDAWIFMRVFKIAGSGEMATFLAGGILALGVIFFRKWLSVSETNSTRLMLGLVVALNILVGTLFYMDWQLGH